MPWIPCILGGIIVGAGVGWWSIRPAPPFVPSVVGGRQPETKFVREDDGHLIRTWTITRGLDAVSDELSHELKEKDGWQPPWPRNTQPRTIQFARVHSPNGDFQFTRVTITDLGVGKTSLTIDEEPKQAHAFR